MHGLFVLTIGQHGQVIDSIPKSLRASYLFSGAVGPVVQVSIICLPILVNHFHLNRPPQAFFATRVSKCFAKPYLGILCWILTICRILSGFVSTGISFRMWQTLAQFKTRRWHPALTMGLILEASVDILVATSLCYFFLKSRYQSVHKRYAAVRNTK